MQNFSLVSKIRLSWNLALHNLKARYKGSILGFAWSFTYPCILFITYYIAFKHIIKTPFSDSDVVIFAFSIFFWYWIAQSLSEASVVLLGNRHLIAKVPININVIVGSSVISQTLHFLITSITLLFLTLPLNDKIPNLFIVCLGIGATSIFLYCLYLILGILNVFYRDIQHLVSNLITPLFFFTPIVYDFNHVSTKIQSVLLLNPFTSLTLIYKWGFHKKPDLAVLAVCCIWIFIGFLGGILIYKRFIRKLLDNL